MSGKKTNTWYEIFYKKYIFIKKTNTWYEIFYKNIYLEKKTNTGYEIFYKKYEEQIVITIKYYLIKK